MKKILIIDDDQDLCQLIKKYLERENYTVDLVNNGQEGIEQALKDNYQVIVLDVMLPLKSGLEVLSEIRKVSDVPIIMLTAKNSETDKVIGLRMGADDYLTKPFSTLELLARIEALMRRLKKNTDDEDLIVNHLRILVSKREVYRDVELIELTAKEFDLLAFLAKNKGKVFTKKQIYHQVWQDDYAYDDNNIMVHMRRLRMKIELDPQNPELIQTVWGVGYKFKEV